MIANCSMYTTYTTYTTYIHMYMLCVMHKGNIYKYERVKIADIPLHALFLQFFFIIMYAAKVSLC